MYLNMINEAMDINNPITRSFSVQLASEYPGEYNLAQVCNIYDYIRNNWKYVNDPRGLEYFEKASITIQNGLSGDCDDFAVLIATAIESVGGRTRICLATNVESGNGHAFTEVYINADPNNVLNYINKHYQTFFQFIFNITKVEEINYSSDPNSDGIWLNLDWNSEYPGGEYFDYKQRTIFFPRENYYLDQ